MNDSSAARQPSIDVRTGRAPPPQLSPPLRLLALAAGLALLALLIIASRLEPAPQGFGTHRQLGLPPCTSVAVFGVTCPSCGMTTSWALAIRGQIGQAAATNAGGLMLAVIAIAYLPASCYFCIAGRASRGGWYSLALAIGLAVSLAVAVLQWSLRLMNS